MTFMNMLFSIPCQRLRCVLTCVFAMFALPPAFALIDYPGRIDDTFGNYVQNYAGTRLGASSASLSSIAVQPNGSILIAGTCTTAAGQSAICVGRLSASGVPDNTYANAGVFRLTENGITESYGGLLAQLPDGSALVAGTCGTFPAIYPCMVRLTPDGQKDTSFGTNGFVAYVPLVTDVKAVLLRKSGKLVVLGVCSAAICIAQFSANGTFEIGFRTTYASVGGFFPNAIAEEASNRLVIAGTCSTTAGLRGCAVRYYPLDGISGTTDPLSTPYVWNTSERSNGSAIAIQPDGSWLLGGYCEVGAINRFCALRMKPNGTLDPRFGSNGFATFPFTGLDNQARAMALQSDGKIQLVGLCRTATDPDYVNCAMRLEQDGSFDRSFGFNRDGRELVVLDSFGAFASTTLLQRDGQLLVGGSAGEMRVFRLRGGAFGARNCDLDVDGDNIAATESDLLLAIRASLGFTGTRVTDGLSFATHATRKTWPGIRDYLVNQCAMPLLP